MGLPSGMRKDAAVQRARHRARGAAIVSAYFSTQDSSHAQESPGYQQSGAQGSAAPGFDHQHSSSSERHVIVRAFAGGPRFHHAPGRASHRAPGAGRNDNLCGQQGLGRMPQPGAARVPGHGGTGTTMIATAATPPGGTGRRTQTSQPATCPAAPGQSATPGLVTSCRSQRRCSSGRDSDACVTAGQTASDLWILPLRMPLTGCTLTSFDSNYLFDLGGAKRARTADLLHACESWACRYRALRLGPARVGVWQRRVTLCMPDRLLACLANDLSPGLPAPAWPPSLA
jgi:hypothetical protein